MEHRSKKPFKRRAGLLRWLTSHPSRKYYLSCFLVYLGFLLNTFFYFFYSFYLFKLFDFVIDSYESYGHIKLKFEQKEILAGFFLTYVIFSWIKLFAQGFDGDAFSHILYWRYRLINKGEMVSRLLGGITAGGLFGVLTSRYLQNEAVTQKTLCAKEFVETAFNGCPQSRSFVELLLQPLLSLRITTQMNKIPILGLVRMPKLYLVPEKLVINRYLAIMADHWVFEFSFGLMMYVALSVCMVAHRFGNFLTFYVLFKRCALFTANAYLRNIHGSLSLDASIATRRYFQDGNLHLYICRITANFLAAVIAAGRFNPVRSLPYHDFKEVFTNVKSSKMQSMDPGDNALVHACSWTISEHDLDFSLFPNTFLGRLFHEISMDDREKSK